MNWNFLTPDLVEAIHDAILNPGELQGRAQDKFLESALARVDNRVAYGMIEDVFDLAASYAVAVSRGHRFNDGNKRTAFQSMDICLDINGIAIDWNTTEIGDMIIQLAQGKIDDEAFAAFLRSKAS